MATWEKRAGGERKAEKQEAWFQEQVPPCLASVSEKPGGAWGISEPDSHQVSRKQHTICGSVLLDLPVIQEKQITQISAWLLLNFFFLMSITISPCGATRNETFAGQICAMNHMSDSYLKCTSSWSHALAIEAWRRKSPLQATGGWVVDVSGGR